MGDVDLNGWSNNPDDMQLDTYFSLDKGKFSLIQRLKHEDHYWIHIFSDVPGLSESFNLPNLKPVIVKVQSDSSGDDFLLTDDDGWFFLWNEADARLWRFKNQLKIEEVVEKVTMDNYVGFPLFEIL